MAKIIIIMLNGKRYGEKKVKRLVLSINTISFVSVIRKKGIKWKLLIFNCK